MLLEPEYLIQKDGRWELQNFQEHYEVKKYWVS